VILAVIIGITLVVIAIAVAIDVLTSLPPKPPKEKKTEDKHEITEQEVKRGIMAYRNRKRIEFGLEMMSKREVRVDRPRGAHRRLQVS
jgi:hypothetical protein